MLQSIFSLFRKTATRRTDGKLGVLIELGSFDKGGLEKVVLDSAIAFDPKRFEVTIVTPGKVGHLGTVARDAGARVVGLPPENLLGAYGQLLKELQIDVAMSHFSDLGYPLFAQHKIPTSLSSITCTRFSLLRRLRHLRTTIDM